MDLTLSNCVGSQPIPSALARNYLNQFFFRSSNPSETVIGPNLAGTVTNNAANVYSWSVLFSLPEALQDGLL